LTIAFVTRIETVYMISSDGAGYVPCDSRAC